MTWTERISNLRTSLMRIRHWKYDNIANLDSSWISNASNLEKCALLHAVNRVMESGTFRAKRRLLETLNDKINKYNEAYKKLEHFFTLRR